MSSTIVTGQSDDRSTNTDPPVPGPTYLHWSPIFAGAIVAAAVSFVLLSFGAGIGLAVASPSSTWRDTSAALALLGGLWLLLTWVPANCDSWPVRTECRCRLAHKEAPRERGNARRGAGWRVAGGQVNAPLQPNMMSAGLFHRQRHEGGYELLADRWGNRRCNWCWRVRWGRVRCG